MTDAQLAVRAVLAEWPDLDREKLIHRSARKLVFRRTREERAVWPDEVKAAYPEIEVALAEIEAEP
jgi:hypothetical protein